MKNNYTATEIIKLMGFEGDQLRSLLSKAAKDKYIPSNLFVVDDSSPATNKYFFTKESIPYLKNFIFIHSILGSPKITYKILNRKISIEEIKSNLEDRFSFLSKKYLVYKKTIFNSNRILQVLCDDKKDFCRYEIENNTKLVSINIIEELEKSIEEEPERLLELAKVQISLEEYKLALNNINRYIDGNPDKAEAYAVKGKIFLKLMEETNKSIKKYKIYQEESDSSSSWNAYEELLQEEYDSFNDLEVNRYKTAIKAYKLLKAGENYSNFRDQEEAKSIIIDFHRKRKLFMECPYYMSLTLSYEKQQDYFLEHKKNNTLNEISSCKSENILLDVLTIPENVHFKLEKVFLSNLELLQFLFMNDLRKYIDFSKVFFGCLKNATLETVEPKFILDAFSGENKYYNKIFRDHFDLNLTLDEKVEIIKKLKELNCIQAIMKNEELELNSYKSSLLKKMFEENKVELLKEEFEKSLSNLTIYSTFYFKILYTYLDLVYSMAIKSLNEKNFLESLNILSDSITKYEDQISELINSKSLCEISWRYECSYVEGIKDDYGYSIFDNGIYDLVKRSYHQNESKYSKLLDELEKNSQGFSSDEQIKLTLLQSIF